MANPSRGRKSQNQLSLKDRWVFATRDGVDPRTKEHIVLTDEEEAAIRVRTVLRRPARDRCEAIVHAIARWPHTPTASTKDDAF